MITLISPVAGCREADVTIIGAVRDAEPVVRLGYGTLFRTTSHTSPVLVCDNGHDEGVTQFLERQPWLKTFSLAERRTAARSSSDEAGSTVAGLRESLVHRPAELRSAVNDPLEDVLARLRPPAEPSDRELTEHAPALDFLLDQVKTRYAVAVDADIEFRHPGWLADLVTYMDRHQLGLTGFHDPPRHPLQERFSTFILGMRVQPLRRLNVSMRPALTFLDPEEATRWHERDRPDILDTGAFAEFPSARFYDTGALAYAAAAVAGLRRATLPASWRSRFVHFGHLSWSAEVPDGYAGRAGLMQHRRRALGYIERRCRELQLCD